MTFLDLNDLIALYYSSARASCRVVSYVRTRCARTTTTLKSVRHHPCVVDVVIIIISMDKMTPLMTLMMMI